MLNPAAVVPIGATVFRLAAVLVVVLSGSGALLGRDESILRRGWTEQSYGAGLPTVTPAEVVMVSPADDLAKVLADGTRYRLLLEPGDYDSLVIDARAHEDISRPLVLMSSSSSVDRKPVFTGRIQVNRPNVYLYGLYFRSARGGRGLEFVGGGHRGGGKVLRCYFEGATAVFEQADMEVAFNEVWAVDGIGFEFTFPRMEEVAWDPVRGSTAGWEPGAANWRSHPHGAFRAHVHHNYFRDWRGQGNGHEALRIGQSNHHRLWLARAIVEFNFFENIRVPGENETVSIKTSLNHVRYNTFIETSTLSVRLGYGNVLLANTLIDAAGIVVTDGRMVAGERRGNQVWANTLENSARGVHLYAGFVDPNKTRYVWNKGQESVAPIPPAYRTVEFPVANWNEVSRSAAHYTVIRGNTLLDSPIELGRRAGAASYPVTGTVIFGNTYLGESAIQYTHAVDTLPAAGTAESARPPAGFPELVSPEIRAFRLLAEDVGPEAYR